MPPRKRVGAKRKAAAGDDDDDDDAIATVSGAKQTAAADANGATKRLRRGKAAAAAAAAAAADEDDGNAVADADSDGEDKGADQSGESEGDSDDDEEGDGGDVETDTAYSGELDGDGMPHGRGVQTITITHVAKHAAYNERKQQKTKAAQAVGTTAAVTENEDPNKHSTDESDGDDDTGVEHMRFDGTFVHGIKEGLGVMHFADGSELHGRWKDDDVDGFGTFVYADGSVLEGVYRAGELDGAVREFHTLQLHSNVAHHVAWHHARVLDDAFQHGFGVQATRNANNALHTIVTATDAVDAKNGNGNGNKPAAVAAKGKKAAAAAAAAAEVPCPAIPVLVPCACAKAGGKPFGLPNSQFLYDTDAFGKHELPPTTTQCFHFHFANANEPTSAAVAAASSGRPPAVAAAAAAADAKDSKADQCDWCERDASTCVLNGVRPLRFAGEYAKDQRSGYGVLFMPDGGAYVGTWRDGEFDGPDNRYYFATRKLLRPAAAAAAPLDGKAEPVLESLRGRWHDGKMVSAAYYVGDTKVSKPAGAKRPVTYKYDPSTRDRISSQPLLPEPYEQQRCVVRVSALTSASTHAPGEGLFAARDIAKHEMISWYSGVRLTCAETDARAWELNSNCITVDDEHESIVVDVPPELSSAGNGTGGAYCASLGHKANHSFDPKRLNAKYAHAEHPRFGEIKAVRATRDIAKGEEVCVTYGYDLSDTNDGVPDWFRAEARKFGRDPTVPPASAAAGADAGVAKLAAAAASAFR